MASLLRPVDFATDGVFMCGMAHSPKLNDETITQANAAVARACIVLSKDYIEAEGKTAHVSKDKCGLCELNCPFSAVMKNRVVPLSMQFSARGAVYVQHRTG